MDRTTRWNWVVDAFDAVAALIVLVSSVYFLYLPSGGLQGGRNAFYGVTILFERHTWEDLHAWAGMAMIVVAAIHLVRHWYWVRLAGRQLLARARTGRQACSMGSRRNLVVNAIVAISFFLAAASGVYFFLLPEGGYQGGRNPEWDPAFLFSRTTWDVVHTWSGVALLGALVVHLWIHWRWVTKVTSRLLTWPRGRRPALVSAAETGLGTERSRAQRRGQGPKTWRNAARVVLFLVLIAVLGIGAVRRSEDRLSRTGAGVGLSGGQGRDAESLWFGRAAASGELVVVPEAGE